MGSVDQAWTPINLPDGFRSHEVELQPGRPSLVIQKVTEDGIAVAAGTAVKKDTGAIGFAYHLQASGPAPIGYSWMDQCYALCDQEAHCDSGEYMPFPDETDQQIADNLVDEVTARLAQRASA